jgi:hypothetical protein
VNSCTVGALRSVSVIGSPGQPSAISGLSGLCTNQDYNFSVNTVTGAATYTWAVPNGFQILSGQGTKGILIKAGSNPATGLTFSVRATNGCGIGPVSSRSGISTSGCARLDDARGMSLQVYPNPAGEYTHVVFEVGRESEYALRMRDASGRTVLSQSDKAFSGRNELDLNFGKVATGVYFIELRTEYTSAVMRIVIAD